LAARAKSGEQFEEVTKNGTLNWDLTTYPSYPDHPGLFGEPDSHDLAIAPNSPNKDAAFQFIQTVLSNEVQMKLSQMGWMTSLNDAVIKKQFGSDIDFLKGKNLQSIAKGKPSAWRSKFSKYDSMAITAVWKHSQDMYKGKDINTIIRETEEDMNMQIAALLSK
jgi:multiple sugar transport system substrate-binding protein